MIIWLETDMEMQIPMVPDSDLLPCCAVSHCSIEKSYYIVMVYSMCRKQIHHTTIQCNTFSWDVIWRNPAAVVKLMCIMSLYNRMEVPNDEIIARVFQDALRVNQPCGEHWAVTSSVDSIRMHVSCEMVLSNTHTQLLFLQGKLCTAIRQNFPRMLAMNEAARCGEICFMRLMVWCIFFCFVLFF